MPYMTFSIHHDNPHPAYAANLEWFETEEEALSHAEETLWAEVPAGLEIYLEPSTEWGDAWLKLPWETPHADIVLTAIGYGLKPTDAQEKLHIQKPGTHPGGNQIWISPIIEVLLPQLRNKQ